MIAEAEHFKNITIQLDGSTFIDCTFESCELVYSGLLPVRIAGCEFKEGITWTFVGAASLTVGFMQSLYKAGATNLIENTFRQIRGENYNPPPGTTLQ